MTQEATGAGGAAGCGLELEQAATAIAMAPRSCVIDGGMRWMLLSGLTGAVGYFAEWS